MGKRKKHKIMKDQINKMYDRFMKKFGPLSIFQSTSSSECAIHFMNAEMDADKLIDAKRRQMQEILNKPVPDCGGEIGPAK